MRMSPSQIETAVVGAQAENLALVLEFPEGQLRIANANDLKAQGNLQFALGGAILFDFSGAMHARAVAPEKIQSTCFAWTPATVGQT